jgi:hypothetical protein
MPLTCLGIKVKNSILVTKSVPIAQISLVNLLHYNLVMSIDVY